MSEYAARAALVRMNQHEVLVAPHCPSLAADLWQMARTDPAQAREAFMARRGELCAAYGLNPIEQRKPFAFSDGIAVIPVHGTLINRFGQSYGSVTGYNFLRAQVAAAAADPEVLGIVYDMNSHGGEAAGCFETAADLKSLANGKPTVAVIDSNCYSAAYAIACAADKIVCTPSGGAGSIGVVAMHVDVSKALADFGVKITFIHAGQHKVDGNPFEPLSDDVKASIQKGVNKSYAAFVGWVAPNRNMTEAQVRATEARVYRADEAVELGLIDAVATPSQAVQAFFGELSGSTHQLQSEKAMSEKSNQPGVAENATHAAASESAAQARAAERARIKGIQDHEEAKGRTSLANHLALNTDLSVEQAAAILAAAPREEKAKEASATSANPFAQAMNSTENPNVGADGSVATGKGGDDAASAILRDQQAATGLKLVKA